MIWSLRQRTQIHSAKIITNLVVLGDPWVASLKTDGFELAASLAETVRTAASAYLLCRLVGVVPMVLVMACDVL